MEYVTSFGVSDQRASPERGSPELPAAMQLPEGDGTPEWLPDAIGKLGGALEGWSGTANYQTPTAQRTDDTARFLFQAEVQAVEYKFGAVWTAAKAGNPEEFDLAVARLRSGAFRDTNPKAAWAAERLVSTGLPRLLCSGVAKVSAWSAAKGE